MDGLYHELARKTDPAKLVGYLNFSDGRPDPKWQRLLADAFGFVQDRAPGEPHVHLAEWLGQACAELESSGSAAFREASQARAVIEAAFTKLPPAYRIHHADLLAHQPDSSLFTAFFFARAAEAVLRQGPPWDESDRLTAGALSLLNDYVGYRPIAILETRPNTEYYPHEKIRPVPLYLKGAGVAPGQYADLVRPALELLTATDRHLLDDACFDPDKLDELAFDPRAHDHFHPINKRPNVLFGEWDPHTIDNRGYYRRFVLREATLRTLLTWFSPGSRTKDAPPLEMLTGTPGERLVESAAVLAGTILMGSGVSGTGPNYYDSTVTLAKLVPKIARYRDAFYQRLLETLPGPHGDRLREEAKVRRQPFAGVRQFLNQAIATQRASHLQDRRLAQLFANMGYPLAARERAKLIPVPAVRFGTEVRLRQTECEFHIRKGDLPNALRLLEEAEALFRRGIDCGAIIDPWNILGYQGLFPIFPSRDDTVRDPRADELIAKMARQFDLYAELQAAAAVSGEPEPAVVGARMRHLAEWWDRFATGTVTDLPRILGGERADAAEHVARALAAWSKRDPSTNDLAFWRQHREGFSSPAAFAQVIEALLEHREWRAAMALLMTWLSESDTVALEDPSASFERLAERWLRLVAQAQDLPAEHRVGFVRRFFELLEANAHDWWEMPNDLFLEGDESDEEDEGELDEDEEPGSEFDAAYEGMTYKDSTDDGEESSVADGSGPPIGDFPLEAESESLERRLRFLLAVARLWRTAARPVLWMKADNPPFEALTEWLATARRNQARLQSLLDTLDAFPVPEPITGHEAMIEYDRRRALKGHLLDLGVAVCVDMGRAARALAALLVQGTELPAAGAESEKSPAPPEWETLAIRVEKALGRSDPGRVRKLLPGFVAAFRYEPLLYCPPSDGGKPQDVLRAQTALHVLEDLVTRLPRLGLLRETFSLTKLARQMEWNGPPEGRRVSSFDQLFKNALTAVVEALLASAVDAGDEAGPDGPLSAILLRLAESFQDLWIEHSQSLRLSVLESVSEESDWKPVRDFIKGYGGELFTVPFLALSNMRGILARGVTAWLDQEAAENESPKRPKLFDAWEEGKLDRVRSARHMEIALQALVEHYDEYRDYNTTTTQSDYGENLYILLDFLRLKVSYDRFAWRMKPLILAHEVLCRRAQDGLAIRWREFLAEKTVKLSGELLDSLGKRETKYGVRLRTIRDRLEERFLLPLQIDRAAARVAPAALAARDGAVEANPAFAGLLEAMAPLSNTVSGVGLEVPVWVRRLEDALRQSRDTLPGDTEDDGSLPRRPVDFSELRRQLGDWDKPIE